MPRTSDRAEAKQDADERAFEDASEIAGLHVKILQAMTSAALKFRDDPEALKTLKMVLGWTPKYLIRAADRHPHYFDEDFDGNWFDIVAIWWLGKVEDDGDEERLFLEMNDSTWDLPMVKAKVADCIAAARAEQRGERKATLAEWLAEFSLRLRNETFVFSQPHVRETFQRYADEIDARPEIVTVLARRQKAEAKP